MSPAFKNHAVLAALAVSALAMLWGPAPRPATAASPETHTWFADVPFWSIPQPWSTNPNTVEGVFTAHTGLQFTTDVPAQDGDTKLNLMMVTGKLPDIITLTDGPTEQKLIASGRVWNLDDFFKHYDPNSSLVKQFPKDLKQALINAYGGWYSYPSHQNSPDGYKEWPPASQLMYQWNTQGDNFELMINASLLKQAGLSLSQLGTESGLLAAFKDYDPTTGLAGMIHSEWNNFHNFIFIFQSYDFWPVVRNTIGINLLGGLIGIPVTVMFALLLNEIRRPAFKSLVQTVTYLPHFLSWVIYGGLIITLLSPDGGVINDFLVRLHLIARPIAFMANPSYFWGIAITSGLLKDLGWGAILYLAAIAGVDQALYEAAAIDGAGRLSQMRHITIPGIMPTLMILVIFAVSGMLNNNFTQIYVMQNSLNLPTSQVRDTYVYQIGLQQFEFATATAIGLMKSVFALFLLVGANLASRKLTDSGLF